MLSQSRAYWRYHPVLNVACTQFRVREVNPTLSVIKRGSIIVDIQALLIRWSR